jgi:hypothetical protein
VPVPVAVAAAAAAGPVAVPAQEALPSWALHRQRHSVVVAAVVAATPLPRAPRPLLAGGLQALAAVVAAARAR